MGFCEIALVLLLDASGSINPAEWRLQTEATAAALVSEEVLPAIRRGGGVAVTALGFTEEAAPLVGWALLRTEAEAHVFAADLAAAHRPGGSSTDIGGALDAGLAALERAPCEPDRRVIDLSSDGKPSGGFRPASAARDRAYFMAVTVNAIGVGGDAPGWLRENAVTPNGFAVESAAWSDYAVALRRKLVRELAER